MSTLNEHLHEYLRMRRALGYHLGKLEHLAGQFCTWLAATGKQTFTTADAIEWARQPARADPRWWGMRLGAVRTFAKYLDAIGVDVQVPPAGILPAGPRRAAPFLYSQADLDALLHACDQAFTRPLPAATMRTTIGLLAATGLRIGEALRLTTDDINTEAGALLIRASKRKDRLVPVHPSTMEALFAYRDLPARVAAPPPSGGRYSSAPAAPATSAAPSKPTSPDSLPPRGYDHAELPVPGCTTYGTPSLPLTKLAELHLLQLRAAFDGSRDRCLCCALGFTSSCG